MDYSSRLTDAGDAGEKGIAAAERREEAATAGMEDAAETETQNVSNLIPEKSEAIPPSTSTTGEA